MNKLYLNFLQAVDILSRFGFSLAPIAPEVKMDKVVVYQTRIDNMAEVAEYFNHLGYEPHLVKSRNELIPASGSERYQKVFLEISSLSDILFLQRLRSFYVGNQIVLIVTPQLGEIINILGNNSYKTIKDITSLQSQDKL